MRIQSAKEKLNDAISKAEKITGKNLTLPVLSCILLEAKGSELFIRATNLDLGIEIVLPVKVEREGKIAVPGSVLNNLISNVTSGKNIILEVVEGNLRVETETNTTVVKSLNFEDFPTIPLLNPDKHFMLDARDFVKGLKSVSYSSATSSMKPELSSVYIYSDDDSLFFVATDSFRLAEKRVKTKHAKDIGSLLIPVRNISDIMRVLDGASGEVEVSLSKNQISFRFGGIYLTSRVVDGIFPDYKQIIPKGYKTSVTLLKQDLVNAFKLATIFSDKFNKLSISVHPSEKKFQLTTKNADVGENTNSVESVSEGDDLDINFNYKYITDSFQSLDSDSIVLEFNGLTKPLIIKCASDSSFLYLVMPINK
jgi:DNA polymerase-3 subunit beta